MGVQIPSTFPKSLDFKPFQPKVRFLGKLKHLVASLFLQFHQKMFMQRTFHLIEITSLRTLDGNNQSLLWENRCNLSECAISTIGSWIWTDPELIAISYMPEICRWLEGKFRGGHLLHPVPADNLLALPVTLSQIELSQFHHLGTSQIHIMLLLQK